MSAELYYAPTRQARRLPLQEVVAIFAAAGLPCKVEPEGQDSAWLAFDAHESNIMASVEGGTFVFGTFNFHGDDPPSVVEMVDRVMQSIGFSTDEGADY